MLENLQESIRSAFGDVVSTNKPNGAQLSVRINHIEMTIGSDCQLIGVSGVGSAGFQVDVDGLSRGVSTTAAAITASV